MSLLDDYRCIVIDLAASEAYASGWCPLCERCVDEPEVRGHVNSHDPRCPWRRAVELINNPEGT